MAKRTVLAVAIVLALGATMTSATTAVAAPQAERAAACSFRGHDVSDRWRATCGTAKAVLRGWLDFGGINGAVAGPTTMVGTWKCYRASSRRLGRCTLVLQGSTNARFRFD